MSKLDMDMTSDPIEFDEAVDEFSKRRIISRQEADELEGYARRRAFWISGVAQMDVVNDAQQSIIEAMKNGTPFEEWKKEFGPKLEAAWGRSDSARIQTIYRNATNQAYNAGRWDQMREPHIMAVREFWMLDVVDDLRTCEFCGQFVSPPVVLLATDPWWLTHCPPFHHQDRCGIRSLRRTVAEKIGVSSQVPTVIVPDGWGYAPQDAEPPKPSERAKPPDPDTQLENAKKGGKDLRERKPVTIPKKFIQKHDVRLDALPEDHLPDGDVFPGVPNSNSISSKEVNDGISAFFEESRKQLSNLSAPEEKALDRYALDGYSAIRDAGIMDEETFKAKYPIASYAVQRSMFNTINNLIVKHAKIDISERPERKIRELYRGMSLLSKTVFESKINESTVTFDTITSTSWLSAAAVNFCSGEGQYSVFYRIKPAKSPNVLSIEGVSNVVSEREVLYGAGTMFRVTKVTRESGKANAAIVWLEELEQ